MKGSGLIISSASIKVLAPVGNTMLINKVSSAVEIVHDALMLIIQNLPLDRNWFSFEMAQTKAKGISGACICIKQTILSMEQLSPFVHRVFIKRDEVKHLPHARANPAAVK